MFADIAGFASWSSRRNPVDVLQLLELLFKEFDILDLQTGVFKVSTIGDCSLETSGLPDIRDDHAEVMAKFSVKFHKIFEVVTTLNNRFKDSVWFTLWACNCWCPLGDTIKV